MIRNAEAIVSAFEDGRLSRRQLVAQLMAIGAAAAGAPLIAQAEQAAPAPTFTATGIDHVALNVSDIARSSAFYQKHLGLRPTRSGETSAFLSCGADFLALFRGEKPGLHHYSFSIPNYDADEAVKRLEAAGLEPIRHGNRVYFPDPDGIRVQVHQ